MKMANNVHELAKQAFDNGNYQLAVELFECILQISDKLCAVNVTNDELISMETYVAYGDALARCGRIRESFYVYVFVCNQLGQVLPLDKLMHLTFGLLECVVTSVTHSKWQHHNHQSSTVCPSSDNINLPSSNVTALRATLSSTNNHNIRDPFVCPVCSDVFVCPVTTTCGHTYCRNCIEQLKQCLICERSLHVYNDEFKQDVLIGRLVEKWWMPHVQARVTNDETHTLLVQDELDRALKSCNVSLEKCK